MQRDISVLYAATLWRNALINEHDWGFIFPKITVLRKKKELLLYEDNETECSTNE